jgi:hypothetical protein
MRSFNRHADKVESDLVLFFYVFVKLIIERQAAKAEIFIWRVDIAKAPERRIS